MEEIINYIKENIGVKTRVEIYQYLNLHPRTLTSIIIRNGIIDDRLFRYCPECNTKVNHKDIKNRIRQEKSKRKCYKCEGISKSEKYKGEGNPFFGKEHSQSTIEFYKTTHKGKRYSKGTEFKKGLVYRNQSNYKFWTSKYGKEIADIKMESFKIKISKATSGKNNPMFGKPSPVGSGNGWSGWYKGWYFRSLLELSYMIFVIERFNLNWQKAERKKYKIGYKIDDVDRNYFADFIIDSKYLVECKPKKLQHSNINKAKFKAANLFCISNNLIYKVVDCYKIKPNELISIYKSGNIKFTKRYELKMQNMIPKN